MAEVDEADSDFSDDEDTAADNTEESRAAAPETIMGLTISLTITILTGINTTVSSQ